MTELIIGMAIAFLLGAYVRQPFVIKRKEKEPEFVEPKKTRDQIEWENFINYGVKPQQELDDEN